MMRRQVPLCGPWSLTKSLSAYQLGPYDPTLRIDGECDARVAFERKTGRVRAHLQRDGDALFVEASGEGAEEFLDDIDSFIVPSIALPTTPHPIVGDLVRTHRDLRLLRFRSATTFLTRCVFEQRVTAEEAMRSYTRFIRRFGEPIAEEFFTPPTPERVAELDDAAFHLIGVDGTRSAIIREINRRHHRIADVVHSCPDEFSRRIQSIRGIGPWTADRVALLMLGDLDALVRGDFHFANQVVYCLTGQARGSDAEMEELLEPYRPYRGFVQLLLTKYGPRPVRFAPKRPTTDIASL